MVAALESVVTRCHADTVLYINKCEELFIWFILQVSRIFWFGVHFAMYIFLDFTWYMKRDSVYILPSLVEDALDSVY